MEWLCLVTGTYILSRNTNKKARVTTKYFVRSTEVDQHSVDITHAYRITSTTTRCSTSPASTPSPFPYSRIRVSVELTSFNINTITLLLPFLLPLLVVFLVDADHALHKCAIDVFLCLNFCYVQHDVRLLFCFFSGSKDVWLLSSVVGFLPSPSVLLPFEPHPVLSRKMARPSPPCKAWIIMAWHVWYTERKTMEWKESTPDN